MFTPVVERLAGGRISSFIVHISTITELASTVEESKLLKVDGLGRTASCILNVAY